MIYKMTKRETIAYLLIILFVMIMLSILFYGTPWGTVILLPMSAPIFKQIKKRFLKKKKEKLEKQFKDMLVAMSDSLKVGYSVSNAMKESYKDMLSVYGYDSDICRELRFMLSRLKLNVREEEVFKEFAERSELRNAVLFSRIFSVAKRTGGNMAEVIRNVTDDIVLKENVKEEIAVSITEKRLEQKVMTIIPSFLIVYVRVMSPGFLDVMYESILGRIIMTVCIVMYGVAFIWAENILDIDVEY